jgi:hypothetical protein
VGDDPVADLDDSYAELRPRFRRPGALDGTVNHVSGDVPAGRFLEMRVYDVALHTWDLARALAIDDRLDAGLAATVLGVVTGWAGEPEGPGASAEATRRRLLEVTGRRAGWAGPGGPVVRVEAATALRMPAERMPGLRRARRPGPGLPLASPPGVPQAGERTGHPPGVRFLLTRPG